MKSKKQIDIFETAKCLFLQFGIKRVSVEEISKKAGVSKVTFYKYYKNKLDLVKKIRADLMDSGFAAFDEISTLDIPFIEKINRMTQWQLEFYSQINSEFISDIVSIKDVEDKYKERFFNNIKTAQMKGEVRPELNLELIYIVVKKLQELTREGVWKNLFSEYGQYVEQIRTIVFFGLLTQPEEGAKKEN